ncbi:hypothetical protein KI387_033799, partial [Taxus chinensis]
QHILTLTNLDLTIPPVSVHVFFCYKNTSNNTFASVLSHLKISLSRALVSYYIFAGRLNTNSVGLPEVLCNNKGAPFTQAYAATALAQLDLYNPDEAVQGKLVPLLTMPSQENGSPVFAVQVTEFSCGSMVVGCTFDHRVADAFSANMFFTCWAKLSLNASNVSPNLSFTRSTLRPRCPPTYCAEIENMYLKQPSRESSHESFHPPLASRIYHLHAKHIVDLQTSINKNGNKYSKLEVFSAYLWKIIMHTQEVKDTKNCRIGIVVDGRSRLNKIGMAANYFGNVLLLPFAESNAGDIKNKSLSWGAGIIHDAIHGAANEEHFQSLIDFVEITKATSVLAKIYCKPDDIQSTGPAVLVSSGLRFPLYEVDYGWGLPIFASYHFPWRGEAGYVMPSHSPVGDGSWVVYMHLPLELLNAIESHPNCILRPICQDLIALC